MIRECGNTADGDAKNVIPVGRHTEIRRYGKSSCNSPILTDLKE